MTKLILQHNGCNCYNQSFHLVNHKRVRIMDETKLMERITINPTIFGGKPIIRDRRLAVEHVLGMLAAGDTPETLVDAYSWLEVDDIQACLLYARKFNAWGYVR